MNYLKLLRLTKSEPTGFTLLEVIFTTVLVGVLAALGISNFVKTMQLEYLKGAASQIYQAISQAQANSTQRKEYWQFSLRTNSGVLQYAVHQVSKDPTSSTSGITWNSLPSQIAVDTETNITNLNSIYQVCFTDQGVPSTVSSETVCTIPATFTPAQITLYNKNISGSNTTGTGTIYKRCVIITTLLGAMQAGQENASTNANGKYCY